MDDQPWSSEVSLTADRVRRIVQEQFPGACDGRVQYLREGWDSAAYLVSDAWVFRFPKRREVDARLGREVRLLDALVDRVSLPVPRVCWRGQPGEAFPFGFMGYRLLPGKQAHEMWLPAAARADVARELGRFLTSLHGVPVPSLVKLGFSAAAEEDHLTMMLYEVHRVAKRFGPYVPPELDKPVRAILDGRDVPPPPYAGPWRLIHRDLQAEHNLLSPDGAVAGIIDFGDATVGDPAVDFVGLYAWQGPAFVRDVLCSYGRPTDASFWERVSFMGRCMGLIGLGWADKTDPLCLATYVLFLQNAFAEELP